MGPCGTTWAGQGVCGPSASPSPRVPAVLASPTRWSKAPGQLLCPWPVAPPGASSPLCFLPPKPEQRRRLGVTLRLQAASEGGPTQAWGSPDCFIGVLRAGSPTVRGGAVKQECARGSPLLQLLTTGGTLTFTILCLSTEGAVLGGGKPPESAEQGPCQPAPLPPYTPKPSLFQ